jgi:hypothetical protein
VTARALARPAAKRGEDAVVEAVEVRRHLRRRAPGRGGVVAAFAGVPGGRLV